MRGARSVVRILVPPVMVILLATTALAAWTPTKPAGAPSSWNPGKALAATDDYVLSAWATDCPPPSGRCARNSRPTMGVFVQRARANRSRLSWQPAVRVSPRSVHAERASLAADGSRAIVGWVTQTRYLGFRPGARRSFWIRRSGDQGKRWGPPVLLSGQGRVDYPRLALAGSRAYAVWTDADDGRILLAISTDSGRTWTKERIGSTTSFAGRPAHGYAGFPDVGASGQNVVITWYADAGGRQVALASSNGGDDLGPASVPEELTAAGPPNGIRYGAAQGATDGSSNRVAVAYTTDAGLAVRVWVGGVLNPERTVFTWPLWVGDRRYASGYGPAVLPSGPSSITVAIAACRARQIPEPCDGSDPRARIDILVTDSADAGFTWTTPDRITNASIGPYRTNAEPSLAQTGPRLRVAFDRYQASFADLRVMARTRTP